MPPDWRLFHVRRSSGRRLFFEVPRKKIDVSVSSLGLIAKVIAEESQVRIVIIRNQQITFADMN